MRRTAGRVGPLVVVALLVVLAVAVAPAAPPEAPTATGPAAADGFAAARRFADGRRKPDGLAVDVFAAAPQVESPVALSVDDHGRVFAAEVHRVNRGVPENRTQGFLLTDDLRLRSVDDRLAMYRKWAHKFDGGMGWFTRHSDRARRLVDADGDGRADRSTVFADGFDRPLDGLAAGVLAADGDVFVTCIPSLWRLRDADGDGVADDRTRLLTGFGVGAAFFGHDLHGLAVGPDGRRYFSVGDRGFHVVTKEGGAVTGLRTGAVFRCDRDGRRLEVGMRGLRNPQELAFDQFGNPFAADNNCDLGDHARLVYVVGGGDGEWDMSFQTMPPPSVRGRLRQPSVEQGKSSWTGT